MSGAYLQDYTSYAYEISWMIITWGKTGVFCDNLVCSFAGYVVKHFVLVKVKFGTYL